MQKTLQALLICSMGYTCLGAGLSVDTSCSQPGGLLSTATVSVSPATVGTGLQPVTATISGFLGLNVLNSTIAIVATVNDMPVLSLRQDLCQALQVSSASSGSGAAPGGLLQPVVQILNPLLGTVNQLTSGLPIVGPLVGPLVGGLTAPLTGSSQGGLLGTSGGLLAPVSGVLQPVQQIVNGLPIAGPLVGGILNPLLGQSGTQSQGGLLGTNGGLLAPVTGLLSPVLGTVNQLTSGLPIVGPLLGGLLGPLTGQTAMTQSTGLLGASNGGLLAPVTGLLGGTTGGLLGSSNGGLLAPVTGLLGTTTGGLLGTSNGGLLAPVTQLLNPVLGTVTGVTSNLPIVGPLLNGVLGPLTGSTMMMGPSTNGGLVNGVVVPVLNTATQVTSGLPVVGPLLNGILAPVTQLVVDVLNAVIGLLQSLPVVGGVLTSVTQVVAPGSPMSQGCPLRAGPVTLKFNLNLPVPALPSVAGQLNLPAVNVLVGLYTNDAVPKELVCAKVKVAL